MRIQPGTSTPVNHEILTVDNSATGTKLTVAKYAKAQTAYIMVEGSPIRFWFDAIPTATDGIYLKIGDEIELDSMAEISNFTAISTTAVDAKLSIVYNA
jgi:hypothetical protein